MKKIALLLILCIPKLIYGDAEVKNIYDDESSNTEVYDPYEKLNRKIFIFNGVLDTLYLRPVAIAYDTLPKPVKARVGDFIDTWKTPISTVNSALQGNPENALLSFWKFTLNMTFGLGGVFNFSSKVNLKPEMQDFGKTLACYGVPSGPYLVIPIFGSSSLRDMLNFVVDPNINPSTKLISANKISLINFIAIVDGRAKILPVTEMITKSSTDPYLTIKNMYNQNREHSVKYPKWMRKK